MTKFVYVKVAEKNFVKLAQIIILMYAILVMAKFCTRKIDKY